jgi:hypothetical protein
MEIYSPKSKNKSLFNKNQFKPKETDEKILEMQKIRTEYIHQAEVIYREENALTNMKKSVVERLKVFFQMDEAVR